LEKLDLTSIDNATNANLVKLNVYSNIFEELIGETPTFGELLNKIKAEYDDYLFFLLRNPDEADGDLLESQMKQSEAFRERNQAKIRQLDADIDRLEKAVLALCETNQKLEEKLKEESDFYTEKSEKQAELGKNDLNQLASIK
jgi:hypothetical protein